MASPPTECRLELRGPPDKEWVVLKVLDLTRSFGFTQTEQFLIATAAAELATNIIRFARSGEIRLREIQRGRASGLEIEAIDQGSGIADIEQAMQAGYTTMPGSLGLGLPMVRRLADEFEIKSEVDKGVQIHARFWGRYGAD